MKRGVKGFTLIELLIVVAIIGILAAIAVPNFIHALGKAKAAKAISDMKALGSALEMYHSDQGAYPPDSALPGIAIANYPWQSEYKNGISGRIELMCLTSPISYIASLPSDPFHSQYQYGAGHAEMYPYSADMGLWGEGPVAQAMKAGGKNWLLMSCGPDKDLDLDEYRINPGNLNMDVVNAMLTKTHHHIYDPSNGMLSSGDFPWLQGVGIPEL